MEEYYKQVILKCKSCGNRYSKDLVFDKENMTLTCKLCRSTFSLLNVVDKPEELRKIIERNEFASKERYERLVAMYNEHMEKTGEVELKVNTAIGYICTIQEDIDKIREEVASQGEEIKKLGAKIDRIISKPEQEEENLRKQLRGAMREKYISGERVKEIAKSLLVKNSNDFLANFCDIVYSDDAQKLNAFLDKIDASQDEEDIKLIIEFLINDLQIKNVSSLNYLVKRFKLELTYIDRIEKEAEKISEGIYNPMLKRDLFIAFASADEERVVPIVNYFDEQGFECYFSLRNLRHGKKAQEIYWDELKEALSNCQCLVFMSSDNSRKSSCDALKELKYVSDDLNRKYKMGIGMFEYILDDYTVKTPTLIKNTLKKYFCNKSYYIDKDVLCERIFDYIQEKETTNLFNRDSYDSRDKEETKVENKIEKKNKTTGLSEANTNELKTTETIKTNEQSVSAKINVSKSANIIYDKNEFEIVDTVLNKYKGTKTEVSIPDGITIINADAFQDCDYIESIQMFNSVKIIGVSAFSYCINLASISIPSSVTIIDPWAFADCNNLKIVYVSDIESWCAINFAEFSSNPLCNGGDLYLNNEKVTNLTIPSGVTSIGSYAFCGCRSLTSVLIPSSVTSIGEYAFEDCSSLKIYCEVESKPSGWDSDWNYSDRPVVWGYKKNKTLLNYDKNEFEIVSTELKRYKGKSTKVVIPYGVTSIDGFAFKGCSSLTSIEIPSSVTSIGWSAFLGCSGLTSIEIPSSVTSIDSSAFKGCSGLKGVYITDIASWCKIGFKCSNWLEECISNPLYYAKNLYLNNELVTDLVIPNSVTSIGDFAFKGCSSLTSIEIPSSVTSIGDFAFKGCSSLTSILIPSSVVSIGYGAFEDCSNLEEVYITDMESWCAIDFENVSSNPLYNEGNLYLNNELVTNLVIPSSVTSIGSYAFFGCISLTSIEIPSSVTSIGALAFLGCSSLTSISIPNSVTSIGGKAFYGCSSLTSIEIPSSVTSIGNYAFYGCISLTSIHYDGIKKSWRKINNRRDWKNKGRTIYCTNGKIKCIF